MDIFSTLDPENSLCSPIYDTSSLTPTSRDLLLCDAVQ